MFHIAFVEDNPAEILLTRVTCEDLGFNENERISFFEDETSFYEAVDKDPKAFNIIFLDVNIGNTSGFDVLQELHNKQINTPILMYSNSNNPNDLMKSRSLEAAGYIQKPYDYDNMKSLIQLIRSSLHENNISLLLSNKVNLLNSR